ncbi:MAG: response regulator [Elusimicrobia bacterium]|nr:response regulator [Elusimicrobiota bacterium]
MKIRAQLSLAMVGIAAASSLVIALFAYLAAREIAVDIFLMHQTKQTEMLGAVAGAALERDDQPVLQRYLESLLKQPMVAYAYVVDPTGRIILHTDPAFVGQPLERWRASPAAASALELATPVGVRGREAGYARIGFAEGLSEKVSPTVSRTLLPRLGVFTGLGIAFGILLGIGLAFYISQPIEAVTAASRRVGEGELSVRVPVSASSEVGDLIRQFNDMAARLKVIDELKDEFISNVSHDLRNPMAAIQMSADYLLNMDPDRDKLLPKHRTTVENMMSAAARLSVFVTNILDRAKMKAGRMEYRLEPVSLQKLAKDLEELYAVVARHRRISLKFELPADLPAVLADPQRLEHVLSNLLSNALKYTPEDGTITLGAKTAGDRVDILIADTGRGISQEALPRLFQRFEQDRATQPAAKGAQSTGLGLYIVKQTVEGMKGSLALESELGKGTRVTLSFPAAPLPAAATAPPSPAIGRRAKILVVDDDMSFAEMTVFVLESMGYEALVIAEGRRAAQAADSERPDLLLMDMDLGGLGAAEVIRQLKAEPATARIPVILCSAVKDLAEVYRGLESGAEFFLRKPLDARELDLRIKRILKAA